MAVQHWIGAEGREIGERFYSSRNPSRPDQVVAEVPEGGAEAVAKAVQAAGLARGPWSSATGSERSVRLYAWAAVIEAEAERWASLLVNEVGKPVGEAKGEVGRCVAILRYYANEAVRPSGQVIPALAAGTLQYAVQRPVGIVGLVTPWNFPYAIPLWKAAPALAVGNTVVWKPSEESAACAELLAASSARAGMPAGVFNAVFGGAETGKAIAASPMIGAVSFTGSVAAGKSVALTCAGRNAKFQTEMGGKNVGIVLPDASMDKAAALIAAGAMRFAGQKCTATSRVVVVRSAKEAFLKALKPALEALPSGDPNLGSVAIGPVINSVAHQRLGAVVASIGEDAWWKGETPPGYGVPPVVVEGIDPGDALAQEELFGPILVVMEAEDADDAVRIANSVEFGLSAALYTASVAEAVRLVPRIEAGLVRVNGDTTGVDPHSPFGGLKASSSGTREQGTVARDFFTDWQTVQIAG
ncbi:MAG: aldehyde dehydrogenase family protein [Fimbriimonadaceae bacterium]